MEKYTKIVKNLFSIFSNNEIVSKLKSDDRILHLSKKVVNDLIYLEKNDENALYDNQKWSIVFAKAFVKLLNKPITFEISNGQNIDGNLDNLNEYIFSKYNVDLKQEEVVVSAELLKNIVDTEKNKKVEDETKNIDNQKTISLDSLNKNNNQHQQAGQFNFDAINNLKPPHFNERFYPYQTKPKNIPILKKVLFAFFVVYLVIYVGLITLQIYKNTNYPIGDENKNNAQQYLPIGWNIFWNVLISIIMYFVFRKPIRYSEQYHIKNSNLIFLFVFVLFEILFLIQLKNPPKKESNLIIEKESLDKIIDVFIYSLMFVYSCILGVLVAMMVNNPKLDKAKLERANMYYMRRMEDLNNGVNSNVNYEDLYDSQTEFEEFQKKYYSAKSKSKK